MSSLQEREVQRYYQPWLAAHGSSLNVAKHVESIARLDLHSQGYQPRNSRDKAITAFAQLVALQLNVRRCMISLIDYANQYILAEATRSGGTGEGPDGLWLGSAILSRSDAICEHVQINSCSALETDGRSYVTKGLVVNDCRLDDRFKDRSYVVQEPGVRFYAGVPLYSRNGYAIGTCSVSDDAPRNDLTADGLRLMQETANAAVEHLEWARDRVDRFKGERIVRGMATFIEDCSSHREGESSSQPSRTSSNSRPQARLDNMSRMFSRATDILRDSTLADGAAIFGASTILGEDAKAVPSNLKNNKDKAISSTSAVPSPNSDSERHDTNTSASDSDSVPATRYCKILAFSLSDDQARAGIESGSALTLGTLERYFALFPGGRAFSFTEQGAGVSSEDDSASDREPQRPSPVSVDDGKEVLAKARSRKRRMDHKELLKKIPGAQSVVWLPLYDHAEDKLLAGVFLWTSVTGRMMSLDPDLSYLRAFGNSIVGEVVRMNMQRNEAAKTTFIASMSHELRSPLHGILGAAEFLTETATDAYQSGLITSITTCGKTLLDTLNHVLDYSKINKLGRAQMRKHAKANKPIKLNSDASLESFTMTAEVDLGTLVEEVAEAVTAGHAFKTPVVAATGSFDDLSAGTGVPTSSTDSPSTQGEKGVSVLLDISPRRSWMVRIQPGALRRIIMNLLGNALKYTTRGFVAVSLRAQESNDSKVKALIRVVDSGKGMSDSFQRDCLFIPFSQEDPFQPGTGLGLSIVKQLVDSLGGSVDVRSQPDIGTEIDVHLSLPPARAGAHEPDQEMAAIEQRTRGLRLVIVGKQYPPTHPSSRLEQTLREACSSWFGMVVTISETADDDDADIYLYPEPPAVDHLAERSSDMDHGILPHRREVPMVIVYMNADEVMVISRNQQKILSAMGRIVEVVSQPCGPRKLAKAFSHCLRRGDDARQNTLVGEDSSMLVSTAVTASESINASKEASLPPQQTNNQRETPETTGKPHVHPGTAGDLGASMSPAVSYPAPPPIYPDSPSLGPTKSREQVRSQTTPTESALHILVVDDNKINRQLLVMFMKKCKFSFSEAENGQEAFDRYKESCLPSINSDSPSRRFDYVLMDISMPVMDGMEATRHIREFEAENSLSKTTVIALTGLASAQAQTEAAAAGINVFLPKPVRFADLKKLLTERG